MRSAGCHPSGTLVVDRSTPQRATVTAATSTARRSTWLVMSAFAIALNRGLLLAPSFVALGVAFASVFPR